MISCENLEGPFWPSNIDEIIQEQKYTFKFLSTRNQVQTRPMHWRTDANLYPPERQLTKASEPSFDL